MRTKHAGRPWRGQDYIRKATGGRGVLMDSGSQILATCFCKAPLSRAHSLTLGTGNTVPAGITGQNPEPWQEEGESLHDITLI